MLKALIFDWGDTIMRDYPDKTGPMADWDVVEWIPGAEEALKKLYEEMICCIATGAGNSDTALMIKALKRVEADQYFTYFFSAKDIGFDKPDVNYFTTISNRINVKPGNCMFIGNDYEKDIKGARASGMKTIYFNEKNNPGPFPDAHYVVNSINEVPIIVNMVR
jgi:FMN phosphatase YigB (HAD superfamily)